MNQLQIIVHRQARVLTTGQLAESYGAEEKLVQQNFSNNKARYKEGKHFYLLQGEELKAFKDQFENLGVVKKNTASLYLWTEKGAWLHAKSLNTDEAWDAYEMLVDEYYNIKEILTAEQQSREHLKMSIMTSERVDRIENKVSEFEQGLEELKDNLFIVSLQAKAIKNKVGENVYEALGGKNSNAFKHLRNKLFSACWRDFKNYFDISEYRELPRVKFEMAMKFLFAWQPSTELRLEIEHYNTQLQLKLVK